MATYYMNRCLENPAYGDQERKRKRERYQRKKEETPNFLQERADRQRLRRVKPGEKEKEKKREQERLEDPAYREKRNTSAQKSFRRRMDDPEKHATYLANNRVYRQNEYRDNPEYREKCKQRFNCELSAHLCKYRNSAKANGKPFELTRDEAYDLFLQECFYCGEPSRKEKLMGLDRFDNARGYLISNVVPACWTCNVIKHKHAWPDVKKHLQAIVSCSVLGKPDAAVPFNPPICSITIEQKVRDLKRRGRKDHYEVTLTDEQITKYFRSDCVYCSATPNHLNGIDRVDNDKGYLSENTVPCCKICNIMKQALTKEIFLAHVQRMVSHDAADIP